MGPPLAKEHAVLRSVLVRLPGVTAGQKFGGEAFFYGKRFFCHFHSANGFLFLETFVWDKVSEVVKWIPGTKPHPRYGGYGWVRFEISSSSDLRKARRLIELSYRYMVNTKRISLPKNERSRRLLKRAEKRFPTILFGVKESLKRMQVIMEAQRSNGSVRPTDLLRQATMFLRQS